MDKLIHGTLTPEDRADLARARQLLERTSLAVRLAELIGRPIEAGLSRLPDKASSAIQDVARAALEKALGVALWTLGRKAKVRKRADALHRLAGAVAGAAGGTFGLGGLAVELPVTTVLMLRAIGEIARAEGHDLEDTEVQLSCLEVFALGSPGGSDDAAETAYYAVRAAMAKTLSDAAQHVAARGLGAEGAPILVRLVERIAARFGIVVQQKAALEAIPIAGALGGALVNVAFMEHYQRVARGHFIVRRLEARYGEERVREAYEEEAS